MLYCMLKNRIQVVRFLKMMSVTFFEHDFHIVGLRIVGFCEMFVKRGTLQKSGREVLREEIFVKYKHYFPYKLCHSLRFISHVLLF